MLVLLKLGVMALLTCAPVTNAERSGLGNSTRHRNWLVSVMQHLLAIHKEETERVEKAEKEES